MRKENKKHKESEDKYDIGKLNNTQNL